MSDNHTEDTLATPEPPRDPLDRPCPFITFYSFKGGVGRSMALINVAGILAARGFRVLVIDLDLEAPGLSFLARHAAPDPEASQQEGFIDCLLDAIDRTDDADLFRLPPAQAIDRFCVRYELPDTFSPSSQASLHIMPAGSLAHDYAKRLERLGLANLYRDGVGLALIMAFKQIVQDGRRFDYVFIDSRTGFSDESGICTRDLADALVVLSGLNTQNVEGTARFLGALRRTALLPATRPHPPLTLVLSPIPNGEDALVDAREAEAGKAFTDAWGEEVATDLHIPYHPMLALTEEPHIFRRRRGQLFDAYQRIEQRLRAMLDDTWMRWADRAQVALDADDYRTAEGSLRQARRLAGPADSTVWIDRFANRLAGRSMALAAPEAEALHALVIEHASQPAREVLGHALELQASQHQIADPHAAELMFERAISADPGNAERLGNYALFLHRERKDPDAAEALFRRALDADPRNASNLGRYARLLWHDRRDPDGAEALYRRAIDADPRHADVLIDYADFLRRERKAPDAADRLYHRAAVAGAAITPTLMSVRRPLGVYTLVGTAADHGVDTLAAGIRDEVITDVEQMGAYLDFRFSALIDNVDRFAADVQSDAYDILCIVSDGNRDGQMTMTDSWGSLKLEADNLARMLRDSTIRLVLLNTSHGAQIARVLVDAGGVDIALGTDMLLKFFSARAFSRAFFRSLARGRSIGRAFADGQAVASARSSVDGDGWQLICRDDAMRAQSLFRVPAFSIVGTPPADQEDAIEKLGVVLAPHRVLHVRVVPQDGSLVHRLDLARVILILLDDDSLWEMPTLENVAAAVADAQRRKVPVIPLCLSANARPPELPPSLQRLVPVLLHSPAYGGDYQKLGIDLCQRLA